MSKVPKRINVASLKSTEKQEEPRNNLKNSLDSVEISEDIESSWSKLRYVFYTSSREVLGLPICKHQDWFDDNNEEVEKLISQMHDVQ